MHIPLVLTNRRRRGGSASAPAFSPASLYSSGSQGIWLDPSDLSTMFSDRAGTTPVTTPGTVVGLRLDKSKGLALGAELVTNGTFDSGTTGWSAFNGNTTISNVSNTLRQEIAVGAFANARTAAGFATVVGRTYLLSYDVVEVGSGATGAKAFVGTAAGGSTNGVQGTPRNTAGTATAYFVAAATTYFLTTEHVGSVGTFTRYDNISVRELPGNHAVAPTDAARPTYGVEPKGGRRNLLLATDTLATQSLTVTAVAHTLAFTGTGTVTLSGASIAGPLIGTGASDRVSLTFTPTAASLTLTVVGSVTLGQLELGSSVTAYQKVVTAYDITESGVATTHYVQYDGSDDSMSTAAIDFTATDKMSVFAGVRKLSDATIGIVVELSSGYPTVSNPGCFNLTAPDIAGGARAYVTQSRGTATATITQRSSTATGAAPDSAVLSGLLDISGDSSVLRRNGVASTAGTGDQGTGNYGNYPMFFGRRNNAGTTCFNGRDYGIIIVGKAASAGEITDTETWLAAKTAQVTL